MLWFLLLLYLAKCLAAMQEETEFSGVFRPDISSSANDFSAAWLVSKERLIISAPKIKLAHSMAATSLALLRSYNDFYLTSSTPHPTTNLSTSLMTRDFFDFFVEHLSSTSNQTPDSNIKIIKEYYNKLQSNIKLLRDEKYYQQHIDVRLQQTVAIIIFSSVAFSINHSLQHQMDIRLPFFVATFFSTYRYFKNIIVYVSSKEEKQRLLIYYPNLPVLEIRIQSIPDNKLVYLPREALLNLIQRFQNIPDNPLLSTFKYVYFTEGDQIVHMRRIKELYNMIDIALDWNVVVPHRMNTFPFVQDLPSSLHNLFKIRSAYRLDNIPLINESLYETKGSCCEIGKFEVMRCGIGWWYNCRAWGLSDLSPWFKFGPYGYTFPPTTVHRSRCIYSPNQRLCELPIGCNNRIPSISNQDDNFSSMCGPHQKVVVFGPSNDTTAESISQRKRHAKRRKKDTVSLVGSNYIGLESRERKPFQRKRKGSNTKINKQY